VQLAQGLGERRDLLRGRIDVALGGRLGRLGQLARGHGVPG
jgi:hypothetical protein